MSTTEPQRADLVAPEALTVHEGEGPLYLRQVLASATDHGVEFDITRILPLGLHVRAHDPDTGKVVTIVVDESTLIQAVSALAFARLRG